MISRKRKQTPIGVRVVDPFALQDVDFELRILPSTTQCFLQEQLGVNG